MFDKQKTLLKSFKKKLIILFKEAVDRMLFKILLKKTIVILYDDVAKQSAQ